MRARDVMTSSVLTVQPDTEVREVAALLLEHGISAMPVVAGDGRVLGIVSEGDLINRPEGHTRHRRSWWLELLQGTEDQTREYLKAHGRRAEDVMTPDVVSIQEDTPIARIARLLEKHRIKRVPVLREGRLVGIVSRADLLQGLAMSERTEPEAADDRAVRDAIHRALSDAGLAMHLINVNVDNGAVLLSGRVSSGLQRRAAHAAAEATPGVKSVEDDLTSVPLATDPGRGYV